MNECTCEPAKSRIMAINEQLLELGNVVIELQRVVNSKRVEYYAIDAKGCEKEKPGDGIVNNIEWMIDDIKRMIGDIGEYVEAL